jgi:DNA-binding SARP family transcriptional activator
MPDVEFLLLGTLEVRVGPTTFQVAGGRQRALFAQLLLARGRPVQTQDLVVSIYGGDARPHALHELVSSLRRSLEPMGLDTLLESSRGSYRLAIEAEQLDTWQFESFVATGYANDDPEERAALLRRALDLWRGVALADVDIDGDVAAEVERLTELRAAALADWLDLELAAGRHRTALAELDRATLLDPYNERLRAQLMLALYRDGRQADALRVYQETRRLLDDELGLEPTERLRELERRILNHDPTLLWADAPTARTIRRRRRPILIAFAIVLCAGAVIFATALTTDRVVPAVFADSMKSAAIDTKVWDVESVGNGPTETADRQGIVLTIPAHATPTDASGSLKARLTTYCTLVGGFDVQVDYTLLTWPAASGVALGMYASYADVMRESSATGDLYVGAHRIVDPPDGPPRRAVPTTDAHGTLRIVRGGNRVTMFARQGHAWRRLFAFGNPTPAPASVYLELYTNAHRFSHRQVAARLTNFRVNSGSLDCSF